MTSRKPKPEKKETPKSDRTKADRIRIDILLTEKEFVKSRDRAKALIMAGKVKVNDQVVDKPGTRVDADSDIVLKQEDHPFVSRGGLKIAHAITSIPVTVENLICMDIGASTGGFTDCLLQHGAKKVFSVDVGYGQLAWKLRQDSRVVVLERTNIRKLDYDEIGCFMDLIVADTSFISLKTVIPAAEKFMRDGTKILALIKPQFEAGRKHVGKGGVVKDENIRKQVIEEIKLFFSQREYGVHSVVPSPVLGPKGNQEYIIYLTFKSNLP